MSREQEERQQRQRRGRVDYEEVAKKNKGGGSTTVRLPDGTEWYEYVEGNQDIDFMAFLATEDKANKNPDADGGYEICYREYVVHKEVPTPDGKTRSYCCLALNWNEPCPLCQEEKNWTGKKFENPLRKQWRRLYLVNSMPGDMDNLPGTKKNSWRVIDQVRWNRGNGFGEMVDAEIENDPRLKNHDCLEGGYTARMRAIKDNFKGNSYFKVTKINFTKRDYDYPESLIYSAPCLDLCLVKPDPAELEKLLLGGIPEAGDEPEAEKAPESRGREPASRRHEEPAAPSREKANGASSRPTQREEAEERPARRVEKEDKPVSSKGRKTASELGIKKLVIYKVNGEEVDCEVEEVSDDGYTLTLEGPDGDRFKDVAVEDVKPWRGREAEPAPARKPAASEAPVRSSGRAAPANDDDDIIPDEDEEPAPKSSGRRAPPPDDDEAPLRDEDDDERPRGTRVSRR